MAAIENGAKGLHIDAASCDTPLVERPGNPDSHMVVRKSGVARPAMTTPHRYVGRPLEGRAGRAAGLESCGWGRESVLVSGISLGKRARLSADASQPGTYRFLKGNSL